MSQHVAVASEILSQLGRGNSNALRVMTGAKDFLAHNVERGALSFRIPNGKARDGINYVKVTLTVMDTYTVEFGRVSFSKKANTYTVKATHSDIYCDMLPELFERVTGLFVSF